MSPEFAAVVYRDTANEASVVPSRSHRGPSGWPTGSTNVRVPPLCSCQSQKEPHGNSMNQCRARCVRGARFVQEGPLDLWAEDIVFLACAFAAQRVSEELDRGVRERAGIEPALSDAPGASKDLDAPSVASGEIERCAWGTR